MNRNIRTLKVNKQGQYLNENRPSLTLQGLWLQNVGFNYDDKVHIVAYKDTLIITKRIEVNDEN